MTKYDIVVHNINEKSERIKSWNAGYRRSIKEVISALAGILDAPETYGRVLIDGEPVIHPMIIEITEIPNAKKYEPQSLHLDKDHT